MSGITSRNSTANQLTNDRDLSKIFIWNNRYQKGNDLNNGSYNPLVALIGLAMGRINATGNLAPLDTAASDGSQNFVGILAEDYSIAPGVTQPVTIVDMGDIAQEKIIFLYSGQGMETVVNGKRVKDHMAAQGIKLVPATEMTGYDN